MTDVQKEKIRLLRQRGGTYQEIGEAIELPLATVQSFCRRNGIVVLNPAKAKLPDIAFCLNCSQPITQASKQKPKKFCCPKCREVWWNKNRRLVSSSLRVAHCAYCGGAFDKHESSTQRFCRKQCYINHRFGEIPQP